MYLNQAINQMPFILVFIKQKYQSRWFLHEVFFTLGFSVWKLQVKERQCVAKLNLFFCAKVLQSLDVLRQLLLLDPSPLI